MSHPDKIIAATKERGRCVISGLDAFRLHNACGVPLEIIQNVAREHGLIIVGTVVEGDPAFVVAATQDLTQQEANAADMVCRINQAVWRW